MTRIGVTTGCFYRLDMSFQECLGVLRDLEVDGVEVSFTDWEEVAATDPAVFGDLSREFEFVKVHAPIRSEVTPESLEMVAELDGLREAIGADVVVYHPPKLPSLEAVAERSRVAIENIQRRKGFDRGDLAAFLGKWEGPVVLDVCHAATWGREELEALFDQYDERCSHVHLSAFGEEEHERMVEHPEFMEQVREQVYGHDVVLEHRLDSLEELEEELAFVRRRL